MAGAEMVRFPSAGHQQGASRREGGTRLRAQGHHNAMHAQGLVNTRWQTGPADGLGAMVGAWWANTR